MHCIFKQFCVVFNFLPLEFMTLIRGSHFIHWCFNFRSFVRSGGL